jgi:hypothetical protein
MSVRPVLFNADGSVDVVYDEMGHSGTIPPEQIFWISDPMSGADNHNFIALDCPDGCGGSSTWPVGGGADAVNGQQLFVEKVQRDGCACGNVAAADSTAVPEAHVRLNCSRMDGPDRWQMSQAPVVETREGQPPQTPIVYRSSDRLVVGEHPRGGVGQGHAVQVIALAEYDKLLRTDPAYLSADGTTILGGPPQ